MNTILAHGYPLNTKYGNILWIMLRWLEIYKDLNSSEIDLASSELHSVHKYRKKFEKHLRLSARLSIKWWEDYYKAHRHFNGITDLSMYDSNIIVGARVPTGSVNAYNSVQVGSLLIMLIIRTLLRAKWECEHTFAPGVWVWGSEMWTARCRRPGVDDRLPQLHLLAYRRLIFLIAQERYALHSDILLMDYHWTLLYLLGVKWKFEKESLSQYNKTSNNKFCMCAIIDIRNDKNAVYIWSLHVKLRWCIEYWIKGSVWYAVLKIGRRLP